jgi:hypothetical protein
MLNFAKITWKNSLDICSILLTFIHDMKNEQKLGIFCQVV